MATTLTKDRKTPGVYVTEFSAFPPSVVGVQTAIPIFIGYTQTAMDPQTKKPMYKQAVALSSMADYYNYFGYGYTAKGIVEPQPVDKKIPYDFEAASSDGTRPAGKTFTVTNNPYVVGTSENAPDAVTYVSQFNLYQAMQMFYANGGGNCFVISVANYWGEQGVAPTPEKDPTTVKKEDLSDGLAVAHDTRGGTMLVIPDLCLLFDSTTTAGVTTYDYAPYGKIASDMINQAGQLQDRVAILDMPGALIPTNWTVKEMQNTANDFYTQVAPAAANFSYGTCYGPAIQSSLLGKGDLDYLNLSGKIVDGKSASATLMNNLLTTQALGMYPPAIDKDDKLTYSSTFVAVAANIAAAFPIKVGEVTPTVSDPADITGVTTADPKLLVSIYKEVDPAVKSPASDDPAGIKSLDQYLVNATPLIGQIQQLLADKLNVVPPSGAMAGIWSLNDAQRGVWNAPANFSVLEAVAPMVPLTDAQQGDFNVPLNGNAIDILRTLVNRGTVVWGARTLDGNSLDYRFIQVRRTLIYIEQSIKNTLAQFVFAANDGGTWATVVATISNFLTQLWQAGGLMGDKASDAFTVQCGVPNTMSGLDVLNGYMIVNVTVQMIHPAEFIELTFTQTMQGV